MVGGKIKDFFVNETRAHHYIVKFLVVDKSDHCTVMAEMPKDSIDFRMIKVGQPIWWHNPVVLIKIEETKDVPFKKIGYSGGDIKSFMEDKKASLTKY
jgi:hypothetical protein